MRPDQLALVEATSDPRLHPDGLRAAFVVTSINVDDDRYERTIWLWDGESARPLTAGHGDTSPRFSPDGARVAFLRKGTGKKDPSQVAVMRLDGGEATVITKFALGVSELEWAPDGSSLAVVATEWIDEWADLSDEERAAKARRVVRRPARGDNRGWFHDRRSHIWLVDPDQAADPVCLTPGDFYESSITWHPDSSAIAFLSARHDERGLDAGSQLWQVATAGSKKPEMLADTGFWGWVGYDANGGALAIGRPDKTRYPDTQVLYRIGEGTPVPLTEELDRNLIPPAPTTSPAGPRPLDDGTFVSLLEDRGSVKVVHLDAAGVATDMVGTGSVINGVDSAGDGSSAVFVRSTMTTPAEVVMWRDGVEEVVFSRQLDDVRLVSGEHFVLERDGASIDVWVYLPEGLDAVPGLLNIHGGPATQYGVGFFDEFQVYCEAGYAVIACNPRGSSGAGSEHVRAPIGRWHEERPVDLEDILAALDAALERFPRIDGDRLGVMGGSYGGLMTARIIGLGDRFKSAVAERGVYSFVSFSGASDIGLWFDSMYIGADFTQDPDLLWRASPLAHLEEVSTPTLIIHSEEDYRCPIDQGESLFTHLLVKGVTTEMLRFPGEGHELSRSGSPQHRVARFEAILDWYGRHLRPVGESA